jgi:hypothetical protein
MGLEAARRRLVVGHGMPLLYLAWPSWEARAASASTATLVLVADSAAAGMRVPATASAAGLLLYLH